MDLHARIRAALAEDLGPGDLTTEACLDAGAITSATIVAKQDVVVSGHAAARAAFEAAAAHYAGFLSYQVEVADGGTAPRGTVIARIHGHARALLVGERLALNLLMRMCGIATHVRDTLAVVGPATFRAVDTRKTTPLWRDLEKAAVRDGGGHNHRFGLFDGVLIKDNHIAAVGSIGETVARVRDAVHHLVRIEVEVSDEAGLVEALEAGADGVLLDNMTDAAMAAAVRVVQERFPRAFVEASGNMDAARMKAIAALGLDVVSVGGFVHQARWADLSLRVSS
ncbi:MAG: carboxylating nicotinate-nucleotide diphosphorylase [Alphaproteobacteria bacterium]|nr:carboxylating nicotinate-nucleotide diphosphorylase [Alphaproteobacteria bacterium]